MSNETTTIPLSSNCLFSRTGLFYIPDMKKNSPEKLRQQPVIAEKEPMRAEHLRAEHTHYRRLVEGASEYIISLLPDLSFSYANQAFCFLTGRMPRALIGQTVQQLFGESRAKPFLEALGKITFDHPEAGYDESLLRNDGQRVWHHWRIRAFYDKNRAPLEYVAFGHDVTARKQILDELQHSEERYRTVVENQSDLIARSAPDTTLHFVNQAYATYFVLTEEEAVGKPFIDLVPADARRRTLQILAALSPRNPVVKYVQCYYDTKTRKWQQWLCKGLFDDKGALVEVLSIGRDVTELLEAERKLSLSRDELIEKQAELQRKNTALHEVLSQIEIEKIEVKESILQNVELMVDPLLQRMKSQASNEMRELLGLLEGTLHKLTSPFGKSLAMLDNRLSPREMEICLMIRSGLPGKDIARLLNLSFNTVESHRARIRKKLNLIGGQTNLTTYLRSLD